MTSLGNKAVLSKNLKYYIERSGKDRRELAETWGFPYSTVTDWINGKKYPRIDRIEIMADYFGILKSDLIEDKDTEEKPTVIDDGLSDDLRELIMHLKTLPEDKIQMLLQVAKSIK
jgi:transcriptional regulator with XRE-family HTH domain